MRKKRKYVNVHKIKSIKIFCDVFFSKKNWLSFGDNFCVFHRI